MSVAMVLLEGPDRQSSLLYFGETLSNEYFHAGALAEGGGRGHRA